jgi:uncharacterized membrane protein
MTRQQFIVELRKGLGRMAEEEKREILADYEEHFRMAAGDGKSEEQTAQSLGNPRTIGRSYRIDSMLDESGEGGAAGARAVVRAVFASLGLTVLNAIFVLGPCLALAGAMIGLWAAAASLALTGLAVAVSPVAAFVAPQAFILGGLSPLFLVFAGVGAAALGVLALIGMAELSRLFIRMIATYVRFNARIITRRK